MTTGLARPAEQGHRPPDRLQLRSLKSFLNRQHHGDLPLRHEGRPSTFDGLQLQHHHGFMHRLTTSLSLHNTGTTTLPKNCTRTEKNTVSTCLCRTTGTSTILSRNCWNLSLKITGTPTTRKRSLRELPPPPPLLPPLDRGRGGATAVEAHPAPPRCFFSRGGDAVEQHLFLELRLPLLLLLRLLRLLHQPLCRLLLFSLALQERLHQEELHSRGVQGVATTQNRLCEEGHQGSHVTDRGCLLGEWRVQ